MRARVFVTLKPSVFDPQGKTIADALHSLGYDGVDDVRQGKYFELDLATTERGAGRGAGRRSRRQAAREPGDRELPHRDRDWSDAMKFARRRLSRDRNCDTTRITRRSTCSARTPSSSGTRTPTSKGADVVILPGGFAHGDYLRTGAMARFSPIMARGAGVRRRAAARCSASATASRFCSRPACCPARCCATAG